MISSAGAENRGLEFWRWLFKEFRCQTHSVIQALINQWSQPDQTKSLSTLQKDLDSWIELGRNIESAGPEYRQPDLTKANALLKLVPDKQKDEFLNREMDAFQTRYDYIKRLLVNHRNNVLGAAAESRPGSINDVDNDKSQDEGWYPQCTEDWYQFAFTLGYPQEPSPGEWQIIAYAASENKGKGKGRKGWKGKGGKGWPKGGKGDWKGKGDKGDGKGKDGGKSQKGWGKGPGCWTCGDLGHSSLQCPKNPINAGKGKADGVAQAVSYTHLTLPTICSV